MRVCADTCSRAAYLHDKRAAHLVKRPVNANRYRLLAPHLRGQRSADSPTNRGQLPEKSQAGGGASQPRAFKGWCESNLCSG